MATSYCEPATWLHHYGPYNYPAATLIKMEGNPEHDGNSCCCSQDIVYSLAGEENDNT